MSLAPSQVCAVIPARGGSKGIPRKNLLTIGGFPLVALSIRAARGAQKVGRVAVSTDDAEIAAVARKFGAEVIARPADLSGDTASSEVALLHAIGALDATGVAPEVIVFLQCTSPLTQPADIDAAIAMLEDENADCVFSAAPTHRFFWRQEADGEAVGINHTRDVRPRRQDRPPEFEETGSFYVMRRAGFVAARHRFFGRVRILPVPPERGMEIDSVGDVAVARRLFSLHHPVPVLPGPMEALVMDFDGVLTDDRVTTSADGGETVTSSRGDGLGIERLRAAGVPMVVLSKEKNPVVKARCDKLKLEVIQGIDDKLPALDAWLAREGVARAAAVYIGNDINDIPCLDAVGFAMVPVDADPAVYDHADWILSREGGRGAVREACEILLNARTN